MADNLPSKSFNMGNFTRRDGQNSHPSRLQGRRGKNQKRLETSPKFCHKIMSFETLTFTEGLTTAFYFCVDFVEWLGEPAQRRQLLADAPFLLPWQEGVERPRVDGAVARVRHLGKSHVVSPTQIQLKYVSRWDRLDTKQVNVVVWL